MKSKPLAVALAGLASLGALFLLRWQFSGPKVNLQPNAVVREVLPEEVGRLSLGSGTVVILRRPVVRDGSDATAERVESFVAALKRRGARRLAGSDWAPRPAGGMLDLGPVSAEQLLDAAEKHPDAKARVVFAGRPRCSQPLVEKVNGRPLKLAAGCGCGPNVRRWLESKALAIAALPRFDDPPAGGTAPKDGSTVVRAQVPTRHPGDVGTVAVLTAKTGCRLPHSGCRCRTAATARP